MGNNRIDKMADTINILKENHSWITSLLSLQFDNQFDKLFKEIAMHRFFKKLNRGDRYRNKSIFINQIGHYLYLYLINKGPMIQCLVTPTKRRYCTLKELWKRNVMSLK